MMKKKDNQKSVKTEKQNDVKKTKLTFFPAGTSREDKVSLFSFCLGMIVMTCFFVIDLQIRNHMEMERLSNQLKMTTYQTRLARKAQMAHARCAHCKCGGAQKTGAKAKRVKCPPVWQRQAVFNPAQYAPYDVAGTLRLTGNVCADLPKGVACPEKIDVFVNPKTDYSDEWWTKHWAGVNGISKTDERALKYNKHGVVQKDGSFVIDALPAGTYYVGAHMCVSEVADRPCRPVRFGTEVQIDKDASVVLKQVFPIQK